MGLLDAWIGVGVRRSLAAVLVFAPLAFPGGSSAASAPRRAPAVSLTAVRNVSGVSPWLGLDCNATNAGTTDTLSVGEPDIAVDPNNSDDQVASWMDLYRDNIDTAYTSDGGLHWYRSVPMGLNDCSGVSPFNPAIEGAYDTTVSFAPNGTAYLSSMEDEHYLLPPTSQYAEWTDVQSSTDGGADWSAPVLVPNPLNADDKDMVFADQERPGSVYVAFRNAGFGLLPAPSGIGELLLARSTDGGQTFTTSVLQSTGSPQTAPYDSQLSETSDGTLVYTFDSPTGALDAIHSTDGGVSWSSAVQVAPAVNSPNPTICGGSLQTRTDGGHDAVIDGNTIVTARVNDGPNGTGPGQIELSESSDGGQTWTTSVVLSTAQPIMEAEIAGDRRGLLGLAYYTVEVNDATCQATGATIPATTLVRVSADRGNTWSAPRIIGAPSWNIASAGTQNFTFGYWVGEYFGITATRTGFAAVTIQGTPLVSSPTSVPVVGQNSVVVAQVRATGIAWRASFRGRRSRALPAAFRTSRARTLRSARDLPRHRSALPR